MSGESESGCSCGTTSCGRGAKKMWCVPELNEEYIARMENILDLYERPVSREEPVVCLDERPIALHGEKRERTPVKSGKDAHVDYEYVRKGTANIFVAVEPLAGKHITKVTPTRTGGEFAKMLGQIARRYPKAKTIHLVMDNLSTHSGRSLERHYGEDKGRALWSRFTVHFTPKHASWLNQAEIEISILNRQSIGCLYILAVGGMRRARLCNNRALAR